MGHIYEDYYREVRDSKGEIVEIKTTCPPNFNFAYDVVDRFAIFDFTFLVIARYFSVFVCFNVCFKEHFGFDKNN